MFKKTRRKIKPWLSLLPALLIILAVVGLARLKFFNVKKIDCTLDGYPCPLAFEPALVDLHDKNLFTVKTAGVVNYLKALDSTLTEIKINKSLPNRLGVVLKRSPAIAYVSKDGAWFHLDELGNLVALPEKPNLVLPVVILPGSITVEPQALSELINALNAAPVSFAEVSFITKNEVTIKTTVGPQAVVDPTKPISPAIATLQYILSNLKIGEKLPIRIDLRFDKPILSY